MSDIINNKFLHPGELHVGGKDTCIHTILGSCVAIVAWHRPSQLGGMNHFMLPEKHTSTPEKLDGRFASDALELLWMELSKYGVKLRDCHINLFGGATMMNHSQRMPASFRVGLQNIDAVKTLMQQHRLVSHNQHLGGIGHRKLIFNIANGDVWMWMRRQPLI